MSETTSGSTKKLLLSPEERQQDELPPYQKKIVHPPPYRSSSLKRLTKLTDLEASLTSIEIAQTVKLSDTTRETRKG
jgi:hypothetical protein